MSKLHLIPFLLLVFAVGSAPADDRPNVLFVAVDDLRPELSSYGAKVKTPHLDRLARSGVQFNRAYCQQAVCGASRLSLMTGMYPTRLKEHTYHVEGWRKRHPDVLTLQQHFRAEGYATVGTGKIYHGASGPGVDIGNWDEYLGTKGRSYALKESEEAALAFQRANPDKDPKRHRGPTTEMADVEDTVYIDGARAVMASAKLKELARGEKPYFFAVGFIKPHLPFTAPKRYWDLYERESFSLPSNLGVPPGYPDYARNLSAGEMKAYCDYEGKRPTDFSDELNKRLLHGYAACVSYLDANVGHLLDALEESGEAGKTIVVFWGDHGWKLGDHSSWCKHTNFECDTRVPLMIRTPGGPADLKTDTFVELIDLYPTLCELTGLPIPEHVQGKSFAGFLKNPEEGHRSSAYSVYPHGPMMGHSLRYGNYRYTEWQDKKGKLDTAVLTDLKADPGEVTNVIDDPAHAQAFGTVKEILAERRAAAIQ